MNACLLALAFFARPDAQIAQDALVWSNPSRGGRVPISRDAVQAEIVGGTWRPPKDGESGWTAIHANKDGWFEGGALNNGYADVQIKSPTRRVAILTAPGCTAVYVNGSLRTGDPYQYGYVKLPVVLNAGDNDLLFACARGRLRVEIDTPPGPQFLNLGDVTAPDFAVGQRTTSFAGIVVVNATEKPAKGLEIECQVPDAAPTICDVPDIPPLGVRKVAVPLDSGIPAKAGDVQTKVILMNRVDSLASQKLGIRVREQNQTRKVGFLSSIDGSAQYFALNPCSEAGTGKSLILTLHGAGVEAIGQADAYAPKPWANIVAATNRRPYGFDWEDWGRLDAMEVLSLAKTLYRPDPLHIYLTGHSMGGHGTWTVGATFPDKFAAIAPSAGWCSFFTYVGVPRRQPTTPVEEVLYRSVASSDTMQMLTNYEHEGVYILHGDKDDNVPVEEARRMRDALSKFHTDLHYHEQPGAGHWWGSPCVDWPGIMDLFQARALKRESEIPSVDFVTVNPAVSARCDWATIDRQIVPMAASRIRLNRVREGIQGTTANVESLTLSRDALATPRDSVVELDGDRVEVRSGQRVELERSFGKWRKSTPRESPQKSPERGGPFKQAFANLPVFVYSTIGSAAENQESFEKARFDAESLWYRGNASIDVVSDREYIGGHYRNRNAIVFGNADTNAAWKSLLADSPVQVRRGQVDAEGKSYAGDDLACLFLRPMPGSSNLLVGVVAGTGLPGARLAERLPYFTSGVQYPDWIVIGADSLAKGASGIRACGFFDNDWR